MSRHLLAIGIASSILGGSAVSGSLWGSGALASNADVAVLPNAPRITDTRTYTLVQTVTLNDVKPDAGDIRIWVPVPGDTAWQRVIDRRVVEAPSGWKLVRQPEAQGDVVYVATNGAAAVDGTIRMVVELTVERESPQVVLATAANTATADDYQRELFAEYLRLDEPNMTATPTARALAQRACEGETDPRAKVIRLVHAVGDVADHYSKDPSKPHCGRGSAEDCLEQGGGCCTDLHSLFVAMARSQGIPTRIQFGYRLNPAREGVEYDPSYRCWIETWLPGSGWVATDVVVSDGGQSADRDGHIGHLDANRVWLWEGRGFNLAPQQAAPPINTMLVGWAEIGGVAVDPLPAADGTPPALRRTIRFERIDD